jgi:hypothetical protein
MTELSFRVNEFYFSRSREVKLSIDQIQALRDTFHCPVIASPTMKDLVNAQRFSYSCGTAAKYWAEKVLLGELTDEALSINFKKSLTSKVNPSLIIKGIGSISVGGLWNNQGNIITVSLFGNPDIKAFACFLAVFGLEEAITPSTPEELEKIKLGFLFKFFFPREAYKLQQDPAFATLTLEELKAKMITLAPSLEQALQRYPVQTIEVFPGYVRHSLPIDREVASLGGRALTGVVTAKKELEFASTRLDKSTLHQLTHLLKHGVFSDTIPGHVFTQMVWQHDIDKQKPMCAQGRDVRLYFSLKTLNRGSYQYNRELMGTREGSVYTNRKNILEFMTDFPFGRKEARQFHEVMLPDRIFPEEIQGISVPSKQIQQQVIDHLKKHNLIHNDTINGIPLHQFIAIHHKIPASIHSKEKL